MSPPSGRPLRAEVHEEPDEVVAPELELAASVSSDDLEVLGQVDRDGRVGRTLTQVGVPSGIVVIGAWLARLAGLDLNPLPESEEVPADVVAAFIALLTYLSARRMNRPTS